MYGALNRVLATAGTDTLLFNYGDVGEREQSNFISWNLRRDGLGKFLVGTAPIDKGVFDVIRMHKKLLDKGALSKGPIEVQWRAYLSKVERESGCEARVESRGGNPEG